MPNYRRSQRGEFQRRTRNFEHPYQLLHFLSTATEKEFKPFQNLADDYLEGRRIPPRVLRRSGLSQISQYTPRNLIPHVVDELESHSREDRESQLGGGIVEGLSTIVGEAAHLLGLDVLKDSIFGAPSRKPVPLVAETAAFLTDLTYRDVKDRPLHSIGYSRLPQYDSNFISVWENEKTGEHLVTVRGTRLKGKDLLADAGIFLGKTDTSLKELDDTLLKLEETFPNKKYDISSHSLGSAYVMSEIENHRNQMDDLLFFNPASSPLQSNNVLDQYANLINATYYVNDGDVVGDTLRQRMNKDTLENRVYSGEWKYAPWSAHSLSQWYPDMIEESYTVPEFDREDVEQLKPDETMEQDTKLTQEDKLS